MEFLYNYAQTSIYKYIKKGLQSIATLGNFIQSANYASTTLNIKDTVASRIFGVYEKRNDTWIK